VLVGATVFGIAWRRRSGTLRSANRGWRGTGRGSALTAEQLGRPLGGRATLVQFSSAFSAPCRATRRILADVAAMVDGVAHIEIDAESHLGLVRELGIVSTPTVLLLGADGSIVLRGTGQPRKADVIAALGEAVPGATGVRARPTG